MPYFDYRYLSKILNLFYYKLEQSGKPGAWRFPNNSIIGFEVVSKAPWFGLPAFQVPRFSWVPIVTFVIVSLATICEHLGDTLVTSKVVGQDFYKNPLPALPLPPLWG